MKKLVVVLCAVAMCVVLAACGSSGGSASSAASASSSAVSSAASASSDSASASASSSSAGASSSASSAAADGQLLKAAFEDIDTKAGAHLKYEQAIESMDSVSAFNVYAKGKQYYSERATKVSGLQNTTITVLVDGKVYNLDPDDKTGMLVMESVPSTVAKNPLLQDSLYQDMYTCASKKDFTTEKRELDGKTYTVEVYPASTSGAGDSAFYFDDDGVLKYYLAGPISAGKTSIGEQLYTVEVIDGEVDDSAFTIDGYKID